MFDRDALISLFHERALKFGEFTLASGRTSTYYLDSKQITLHAEGLRLVCEGLLELLTDVEYDAVSGMSIGADPIIGGLLAVAAERGVAMEGLLVRKEAKGHGTGQYVEGPAGEGSRVIVIDDVVTTGGSAMQAVNRIEDYGANVVHVVGIVDRLEGGAATFAERDLPFTSLLTIEDFGITPPDDV
ncbi:MAG TPA: orotate phosphoribosyltransferase [Planctomycetaceae bacterium]|nr:orotate phosphoribosyltransferase [Planctomycetaceae bacterium]|tara:strand:+ start:382 stop:939 length:558 start_codon:yes stop_codon:yes gene_type:complete